MSELAIQTVNLSYNFGNQTVVNNLCLEVPKGSIYGFLGPNGAGKTTTIKILLNLLKSPSDKVFVFGKDINAHRIDSLRKMGALVEQPAIYSHLTGLENLVNRCILLGVPKKKCAEILETVGLTYAKDKKAGAYSLGMKQRLGIGLALISDPELLLLDEPTNGLDPNGIIEIRNLMIDLAKNHHKTILVSSHLLAEIEKTATHVGIINKGALLFQGTMQSLQQLNKSSFIIEVDNIEIAKQVVKDLGIEILGTVENKIEISYSDKITIANLNEQLVQKGVSVYQLAKQQKDLESLFLNITSN